MILAVPRPKKPTSTADLPPGISLTPHGTYRARWRDDGGKPQEKSFKRLVDAKRHLEGVRTDLHRGVYVDTSTAKITVRRFADEWLRGARNLSRNGEGTYRRDLDQFILPELGDIQLGRLTPQLVDDYLSDRLDAGQAPSSVLRHYRTIHRMCEVAVMTGRLQRNPCTPVTPPKVEPTEMRFLTVDQVLALADAISPGVPGLKGTDPTGRGRYRAWVLVAAFGGLRWSELVGLRRGRVSGNRVRVEEQYLRDDKREWHRQAPKYGSRRTIALPTVAADALTSHLDAWALPGDDGLVFPNKNGDPLIGPSFTGNVFKPALRRAGLDDKVRIHDLRHTAVALAIKVGAHPKAIQSRMGHRSITTTLDRYGHLFPEMDDAVAVGLEDLVIEQANARVTVWGIRVGVSGSLWLPPQ